MDSPPKVVNPAHRAAVSGEGEDKKAIPPVISISPNNKAERLALSMGKSPASTEQTEEKKRISEQMEASVRPAFLIEERSEGKRGGISVMAENRPVVGCPCNALRQRVPLTSKEDKREMPQIKMPRAGLPNRRAPTKAAKKAGDAPEHKDRA